jgi:hypothetical protein
VKYLAGKRIALLSEKEESVHFFDALEALLKERYPTATFLRFGSPANPYFPDNTSAVAEQCDTWLQGVKTSGSGMVDYDIVMEKLGRPGVTFCVDSLLKQRKRLAEVSGMPALRILTVPGRTYFLAEGHPEKMRPVAASVLEATIRGLTTPLTDAEKNPKPPVFDYGIFKFTGNSYTEAAEKFQQCFIDNYLGDGLPLTPPTPEAVAWMLTGTSRSPREEIGTMAPRNGMATVAKIAINAVMAGARPEYLPVIIAAIECVTDKSFNLYHLQTSTASPVPIIWVNGPIAREIGMNDGMGYLGRGFRANSTIGRAVSLCLINIGWRLLDADPGMTGEPEGYCNFTFPENEKDSPWESFAAEYGYQPEDSTVTVNEIMRYNRFGPGGGMFSQTPEQSLAVLAKMVSDMGRPVSSLLTDISSRRYEIAIHPTFANQLAEAGYTRQSLAQWLYDHARVTWDQLSQGEQEAIKAAVASGRIPGLKLEDCKSGMTVPTYSDPKHVAILVAGDMAGYTVVWASPVGSTATLPGRIPGTQSVPFMTKQIRGATLTKAGR